MRQKPICSCHGRQLWIMVWGSTSSCSWKPMERIVTCFVTEDAFRIVNWFIPQPTNRNYNYLQHSSGFSHFTNPTHNNLFTLSSVVFTNHLLTRWLLDWNSLRRMPHSNCLSDSHWLLTGYCRSLINPRPDIQKTCRCPYCCRLCLATAVYQRRVYRLPSNTVQSCLSLGSNCGIPGYILRGRGCPA
jgi:hypothetical protein